MQPQPDNANVIEILVIKKILDIDTHILTGHLANAAAADNPHRGPMHVLHEILISQKKKKKIKKEKKSPTVEPQYKVQSREYELKKIEYIDSTFVKVCALVQVLI